MTISPTGDIARDPRWGRIAEGAGEDTYLGSRIAEARVKGFQGNDPADPFTVLACAKHYAAYGAAQAGRDYHTVDLSDRTLRETYLPPFKAALDAGVFTFMSSFNEWDGVPATGSKYLMHDILRQEWGFKGFVVTDYTSINEMIPHGVVADLKEAAELAVNAGIDMDMQGAAYQDHLVNLVRSGQVSLARIDEAVRYILRTKFLLGLFSDPYKYSDVEREKQTILSAENQAAARDVARKSIVLLKNDNNTLPLAKSTKSVALIGPLADNQRELLGSWSAAGDANNCVTLLQGIREKLGASATIRTVKGCGIDDYDTSGFEAAVAAARQSDAVILAVGEAAGMSGEAASRSELDLPGVQPELIKAVVATGKPVIVVLMNGRPLVLTDLQQQAAAILETWFLGTQAGNAIADVLFGDYNPSGRLPVTFPRSVGQVPLFYNMKNTGRPMNPNEKYTSKYLDVANTPLYPFGYGLSYTSFQYSAPQLDKKTFHGKDKVTITVKITNTGKMAGEETVQLYMRDLVGSVTRPVLELRGFQKVNLAAGASKSIQFELSAADLAMYNRDMVWTTEPGDFEISVGPHSAQLQTVKLTYLGSN